MKYLIIASAIILTAVSCQNDTAPTNNLEDAISTTLPNANGKAGTVLVSIDQIMLGPSDAWLMR